MIKYALGAATALACALAVVLGASRGDADDLARPAWGTLFSPTAPQPAPPWPLADVVIQPDLVFPNTSVTSAGCGLRNEGACSLTISGMSGSVLAAGLFGGSSPPARRPPQSARSFSSAASPTPWSALPSPGPRSGSGRRRVGAATG